MAWPSEAELQAYLTAAGLMDATPTTKQRLLDLSGALDAAVDRWNDETRYSPFQSTGTTTEARRFLPPAGMVLDLKGGLLTLTSLTIDITYTSAGTVKTNTQHFRLLPRDAAQKTEPWTAVEFIWNPWNVSDGEIEIVGEWGYCTAANLPKSARRGVLAYAAAELVPQIHQNITSGAMRWTEGDVTKQYGALADALKDWVKIGAEAAGRFRRLRLA